ncbi:uncharacterized protein LOC114535064 [Dendronephthya gigantea]|uniref:uncharacterized protein LOC114535064 n=1 Tax=Dendronephthya gigantea TaxID=151771 RepID=UPI00106C9B2C|nr:uncharacterized protein LOC114535064 [Dendronephthya gigantea]
MFQDASTGFNFVLPLGEAGFWRNGSRDAGGTDDFPSNRQNQVSSPKDLPPSAFKVYDKVSEKHRYVPRQWTQEEFEAALPDRFTRNATVREVFQNDFEHDEFVVYKDNEAVSSRESENIPQNSRTKAEIAEKIRYLKEIFENSGTSKADCKTNGAVYTTESLGRIVTDVSEMDELERCKDSEAKVKVIEKEDPAEISYENAEIVEDASSKNPQKIHVNCDLETEVCRNKFSSFLDACLRCLLNVGPFVKMANISSGNRRKPVITKLQSFIESLENPEQSLPEDPFLEFLQKISERSNCDEVLAGFLETVIKETQAEDSLRPLFHGEFCHIKTCDRCTTIAKETQPFLFLNPTTAPGRPPNNDVLDVNFVSSSFDGIWYITTRQFTIKPGMTFSHLKEDLLSCPEFEACDPNSIRMGEVKDGRIIRTFNDSDELGTLLRTLPSTSSIFAFHVLNFTSEFAVEVSSFNSTAACYQLYFNCGLCLSDGSDVRLYIHKGCGGMVCRDCLDVITQSYQDWELCPCPICERPMDLDKDLCRARMNDIVPQEPHPESPNLLCQVMFRANKPIDGGREIFGCPLIATLPRSVTGHHLYRCIGYLLPNTLPMKDRTSFTLHTVGKSGSSCSACPKDACSGCLVRIDDNVRINRDTNFVVHFDDLAEESMKCFGIPNPAETAASGSRGFFDGILRSCVKASTSDGMVCPKCSSVCKVSSSISEFPKVLLIHLNRFYVEQGLLEATTIAEVSRFLVLQHSNNSIRNSEGPVYQLTAAVLADESGKDPSYKPFVQSKDAWVSFERSHTSEIDPYRQQLTKNSVLFYQPVEDKDPPQNGRVLKMPTFGKSEETRGIHEPANKIHGKKLATISEETSIAKHSSDFRKQTKKRSVHRSSYDRQFEPGELLIETGVDLDRRRVTLKPDIYSSQVSLGEITIHPDVSTVGMPANIDGISPIFAQEMRDTAPTKTSRETKKLIRAVKREDAYGIVCSLKRGADPCLLIDDVSALHLAAGIKSDQRCSMVAYLLKHSNDVNVATGDGTTPLHVAAAWGHQDALELLLCHGGDAFDRTDQDGNTAFDLASKDCSSFLRYYQKSCADSPGSFPGPSTSSRASIANQRLEDLVRCNVTLPSFVQEDVNRSRLRRRWLERFRSFRSKSSGVLRNIRRLSSIRRRSRIGVLVP